MVNHIYIYIIFQVTELISGFKLLFFELIVWSFAICTFVVFYFELVGLLQVTVILCNSAI